VQSHDHVLPDQAIRDSLPSRAPASQPGTVRELAERLLPAYRVDGGTVHLAGCLLEDYLFLRVAARSSDRSIEFFVDREGNEVAGDLVETLGMTNTIALERPPEDAEAAMRRLAALGRQRLAGRGLPADAAGSIELSAVWCKFAQGKLRFTIGDAAADLPFAGWARVLEPLPFVCPHSGRATYHVTALDDGRIVAAEEVATCDESGQRVLARELVTCAATGRRVLPEFTETCPTTGQPVLRSAMVTCEVCRQKVAPGVAGVGRCEACDRSEPISKADPRLARVLDEHPLLDRWRRWRLAESATAYHLTAHGWVRRLLLIVDKDSLDLKLVATGHHFRSGWDVVEPAQYEFVLRG